MFRLKLMMTFPRMVIGFLHNHPQYISDKFISCHVLKLILLKLFCYTNELFIYIYATQHSIKLAGFRTKSYIFAACEWAGYFRIFGGQKKPVLKKKKPWGKKITGNLSRNRGSNFKKLAALPTWLYNSKISRANQRKRCRPTMAPHVLFTAYITSTKLPIMHRRPNQQSPGPVAFVT